MIKNKFFVLATLAAFLCLSHPSYALVGSIQPPRMVLRGETLGSVSGFVNVINPNNISVNISTDIYGDIQGLINLSETDMTLQPNGTRRVDFDMFLPSEGKYVGEIIFVFSAEEGEVKGAALSSTIIAFAEGSSSAGDTNQTGQTGGSGVSQVPVSGSIISETTLLLGGVVIVLVIIILGVSLGIRRNRSLKEQ